MSRHKRHFVSEPETVAAAFVYWVHYEFVSVFQDFGNKADASVAFATASASSFHVSNSALDCKNYVSSSLYRSRTPGQHQNNRRMVRIHFVEIVQKQ